MMSFPISLISSDRFEPRGNGTHFLNRTNSIYILDLLQEGKYNKFLVHELSNKSSINQELDEVCEIERKRVTKSLYVASGVAGVLGGLLIYVLIR